MKPLNLGILWPFEKPVSKPPLCPQAMESKLLIGGRNIMDHTNEQQKMLELKRQEIAEQVGRGLQVPGARGLEVVSMGRPAVSPQGLRIPGAALRT